MSVSTVSAAVVREFMTADAKRLARLSPEGQANVQATRGRLSNEVVKVYNKGRKSRLYVPGAAHKETLATRKANAERREALRAEGRTVAALGRLPKV